MSIGVYCSGSIEKKAEEAGKKTLWTNAERAEVSVGAAPRKIVYLNPDDPIVDAHNSLAQFGRDMFQIAVATAVVVDLRQRRGIGVGVELAAASAMEVPLIAVAPRESHYRATRLHYRGTTVEAYVHPHVEATCDVLVEGFREAGRYLGNRNFDVRKRAVPGWLKPAVDEYQRNVLPDDQPMRHALGQLGLCRLDDS
jgi:hypothetical protein